MTLACEFSPVQDTPEVLAYVRENLPLVDTICAQIRVQFGRMLRAEDLVSYGYEGLLIAARTFDATRGVPFRRWANLRVRGAVIDGIRATSALPRSVYARLRAADVEPISRNEPAEGDPHDSAPNAEESAARSEILERIRTVIRELPAAQRGLLQRHYFDDVSLDQAAAELGLSKSWASRLHGRALLRVRRHLKNPRHRNSDAQSPRNGAHRAPHNRTREPEKLRENKSQQDCARGALHNDRTRNPVEPLKNECARDCAHRAPHRRTRVAEAASRKSVQMDSIREPVMHRARRCLRGPFLCIGFRDDATSCGRDPLGGSSLYGVFGSGAHESEAPGHDDRASLADPEPFGQPYISRFTSSFVEGTGGIRAREGCATGAGIPPPLAASIWSSSDVSVSSGAPLFCTRWARVGEGCATGGAGGGGGLASETASFGETGTDEGGISVGRIGTGGEVGGRDAAADAEGGAATARVSET